MNTGGGHDADAHRATNAWLRALELTAPLSRDPRRTLPAVIDELARRFGDAPALLSHGECLSFEQLAERSRRYARWALDQGIAAGDVVALLMPNRPEYMAIWLGITRVGGVVALINTRLCGASLAHGLDVVAPKHVIVAAELVDRLVAARPNLGGQAKVWVHGDHTSGFASLHRDVEGYAGVALAKREGRPPTLEDRALLIGTSGTTGLPKAAAVSHLRLQQWTHWFAGLMGAGPDDRMYNCLPMYHSVGGVVATGAVLVVGGSVVIREKFSAARFWEDVVRWDCTLVQYIGELCRYLLAADPRPEDTAHRVRMACGNGLRPRVWTEFQRRFRIPRILEFYASTEGPVSLFNVEGKPGAVGRIPAFLAHRVPVAIVKFDTVAERPVRDADGSCVRCAPGEVGELIGQGRFEGYAGRDVSDDKVLRNVFERGDAWVRTGDLMKKDEEGYFHFVDRIGDTFRWKGENVATSEVADALAAFPGVTGAVVYGVEVPNAEGRAGMAAVVADGELSLGALRAHLVRRLPEYARPLFLRLCREIAVTATFRLTKRDLMTQGYDPGATDDRLYVDDRARGAFVPLDGTVFERIQHGHIRL